MKDRSKNKIQIDYTIDDIYNYYHDMHKNDELNIDEKTFKKVLYTFNKRIFECMLEDSESFKNKKKNCTIRV
jgi:hypothetical protein